ncbi:MAG: SLBB domain-containing protein [Blastocatellia bacterium]|nr:SLBB domain-containing protein [Blastocatellia bacterium]
MKTKRPGTPWKLLLGAALLALLPGASWAQQPQPTTREPQRPAQAPPPAPPEEGFTTPNKSKSFTSAEMLALFDAGEDRDYSLGAGDELTVEVWDHPELSGKHIVGPDGKITLQHAGSLMVAGLTRDEAGEEIREILGKFYYNLLVTVRVDKYTSHRVMILGRVTNPGTLYFDTSPTLLEVITRAGGLPIGGTGAEKAALARCAIFRGRDKVVWIELKNVLNGKDLSLNIRLRRNDLVYLPDSDDQLVYVLGEVKTPGAYRLTPNMSFLDALSLAGGPTRDAANSKLQIIRQGSQIETEFSFNKLLKADSKLNYSLSEGDIVFVPPRRLAKAGYVIDKLNPFASLLLVFSTLTSK